MFRVLVADDEKLSREAVKLQLRNFGNVKIVAECTNGLEALAKIQELHPDIIFLDIQMPHMSGLEALTQIPKDYSPSIIIVSAFDTFALQAFENDAIDYLVKPFTDKRFERAMDKAIRLSATSEKKEPVNKNTIQSLRAMVKSFFPEGERTTLNVKDGPKISVINVDDITHIEATENYVTVFTMKSKFLHKETIQSLEQRLPRSFIRIHKSTIVNTKYINEFYSLLNGDYLSSTLGS